MTLKIRHHELSKDTKIIENRHWELRQPYTRKSTKVRKLYWKSDTFSTWETTFGHKVFSTRYKLIHKSRTLRKKMSSTTTSNSRFAGNIFGLAGILAAKTKKNCLDTLTSGSPNFPIQGPI